MSDNRQRTLSRDVHASQIPSGDKHTLSAGTSVFIHQVLGGSYTVQTDTGLYRLDGKDADAIGETLKDQTVNAATLADGAPDPDAVWGQLRQVFDPEIPVNIVDLGLVYSMDISKADDGGHKVDVAMTLTAPGCGMGPVIAEDARSKIAQLPTVESAKVYIVWDPQWTPQMISATGRKVLGIE
jgi:probable FeS assembly SUF system protein SufT